jgi:ubiquinone/menaquinone biosynthesis C-methylase UbiE
MIYSYSDLCLIGVYLLHLEQTKYPSILPWSGTLSFQPISEPVSFFCNLPSFQYLPTTQPSIKYIPVLTFQPSTLPNNSQGLTSTFFAALKETHKTELVDKAIFALYTQIKTSENKYLLLDQLPTLEEIVLSYLLPDCDLVFSTKENKSLEPKERAPEAFYTLQQLLPWFPIYKLPVDVHPVFQLSQETVYTYYQWFSQLESKEPTSPFLLDCYKINVMLKQTCTYANEISIFSPIEHPSQGKQIKFMYEHCFDSLVELVHKMIYRRSESKAFVQKILMNLTCKNDFVFFEQLRKLQLTTNSEFNKAQQRIRELESTNLFSLVSLPDPADQYLDFGGQSGQLAREMQVQLKLEMNQVFVADIATWAQHNFQLSSNQTTFLLSHQLPFQDEQFKFITCFQVLHHIQQYKKTLSEFYRILQPGGYVLIREHDVRNLQDKVTVDVEHSIFDQVLTSGKSPVEYAAVIQAHYAVYFSYYELCKEFRSAGFVPEGQFKTSSVKGPSRYYYSLYRKPGLIKN